MTTLDKSKLFLPWDHNDSGLINGNPPTEDDDEAPFIADTATLAGEEDEDDIARADFIVLACNAYFDLLEGFQKLIVEAESRAGVPKKIIAEARAVIAKAQVQQ